MAKYHISQAGNPVICNAKIKCRLGDMENDHYESKEEAYADMEIKEEAKDLNENRRERILKRISTDVTGADGRVVEDFYYGRIQEDKKGWDSFDNESLLRTEKILKHLDENDINSAVREFNRLKEKPYIKQGIGWSSRDPKVRSREMKMLAWNRITTEWGKRENIERYSSEYDANTKLIGFDQAKESAVEEFAQYYYGYGNEKKEILEHKYSDEIVGRIVNGEHETFKLVPDGMDEDQHGTDSVFSPRDRLVAQTKNNQAAYLSFGFPHRELKGEMEAQGVNDVFVSYMRNGRENGVIYTVVDPDMQTRSFVVYEHRNTDTIVINGKANWDGEGLPYAKDDKWGFYAEIPNEEYDRAAKDLAFFMKEAQEGNLKDDNTMVKNASRVDHNAILAKTIPGFAEFVKRQTGEDLLKKKTDDDVLRDLDFDVDDNGE